MFKFFEENSREFKKIDAFVAETKEDKSIKVIFEEIQLGEIVNFNYVENKVDEPTNAKNDEIVNEVSTKQKDTKADNDEKIEVKDNKRKTVEDKKTA